MRITMMVGLTVAAIGALGCAAAASPGASPAATAARVADARQAAAVPRTFIAVTPTQTGRLAVYSARTGRLIRYLTAPEPGGGVASVQLSPSGRTVLFSRGQGSCAETIDTVQVRGGPEEVLIPMTGQGQQAVIPSMPAYSADGRYLIYMTTPCSDLARATIHVRNLRTAHAATGPGSYFTPIVFLHHDRDIVYSHGGHLVVVNLTTMRSERHLAPRGCVFDAIAGTTTEFAATLQCLRDRIVVAQISPRTFGVTRTLARFGGNCQDPVSLSIAPLDPAAALVETIPTCGPGKNYDARILTVGHGRVSVLLSGPPRKVPWGPIW